MGERPPGISMGHRGDALPAHTEWLSVSLAKIWAVQPGTQSTPG